MLLQKALIAKVFVLKVVETKKGKPKSIDKRQLGIEDRFYIRSVRFCHRIGKYLAISPDGRSQRRCYLCSRVHRGGDTDRIHGHAGRIFDGAAYGKKSCGRLRSHQASFPLEAGRVYGSFWVCLYSLLLRYHCGLGLRVFLQNSRRFIQGIDIMAGFRCHIREFRRQPPGSSLLPAGDHRPDDLRDFQRHKSGNRTMVQDPDARAFRPDHPAGGQGRYAARGRHGIDFLSRARLFQADHQGDFFRHRTGIFFFEHRRRDHDHLCQLLIQKRQPGLLGRFGFAFPQRWSPS